MVYAESGTPFRGYLLSTTEGGRSPESPSESPNVDSDRERRYAAISEEIGAGLRLGQSGGGEGPPGPRPVTLTQVLAIAIGTVSVLLILLGAYPFVFSIIIPKPFEYTNIPFPVCAPAVYTNQTDCYQAEPGYAFAPEMLTPLLVQKCYTNPFSRDNSITYIIRRRLVSDNSGLSITVPDTFIDTEKGCQTIRNSLNAVPAETPPGKYHWEGLSEIRSWRQENIPWRSESFTVQ